MDKCSNSFKPEEKVRRTDDCEGEEQVLVKENIKK